MDARDAPLMVAVRYGAEERAAVKAALLTAWAYIIKEAEHGKRDLCPPVGGPAGQHLG